MSLAAGSIPPPTPPTDDEPPIIVTLPLDPVPASEEPIVRVRILDDSGVGRATLWVRGAEDAEFRSFPMEPSIDDLFIRPVPIWPTRGDDFAFYVEAEDRNGNGPTYSGNPRNPFIAHVAQLEDAGAGATSNSRPPLALSIAAALLLICWLVERMAVRERHREVIVALHRLQPLQPPRKDADRIEELTPEEQADGEFWATLLAPLKSMDERNRRQALMELAGRPHHHPLQGKRFFDRATLHRRLEALCAAKSRQTQTGTPTSHGEAGLTMLELMVVLTLVAVGTGMAVAQLNRMERPVHTAGEMVEGMLQHTRSRAMATTTPHRLRAISKTALIVESGPSCSVGPWTLEPELQAELPQGVELANSGWSICFVSRGAATTNRVVTLESPGLPSQQLQVLIGGAVRWL